MIVLANEEFALGLRLAGIKNSHAVSSRVQAISLLKKMDKDAFIIATVDIMDLVPELKEYENVIVFPDTLKDFSKIDDLQEITRKAIGGEVQL
ncbi:hypothetical protein GOV09_03700 [Candidatus Woesearchaeota archaeon]|nr:hypothetical protein [Candidatus Woesearchaeota archaeon]